MNQPVTIYADYQATTPVDPRVQDKMAPFWGQTFGNPHSSDHIVGWRAGEAVREAAESVAALIGADGDEVIFTSGATEANNLAISVLRAARHGGRDRVLVSAIEHKCVLAAARAIGESHGVSVETIPVDSDGLVEFDALEKLVDERVLLASVMAVNNEVGTIQDIRRIAELLVRHGILFHCDAAQAPCAMDVSNLAAHADLISLSAHKMYGPQGIGALYIRRDLKDSVEPMIYGGRTAGGPPFRHGSDAAFAWVLGLPRRYLRAAKPRRNGNVWLASAIGSSACWKKESIRSRSMVQSVIGAILATRTSALTASMHRISLASFSRALQHPPGAACTTGIPEPSHVLRATRLIGRTKRGVLSGSVLADSPLTMKSKMQRGW